MILGFEQFLISFIIVNLIGASVAFNKLKDQFNQETFNKLQTFNGSAQILIFILIAIGIFGFVFALLGVF